jgi:hypothetical protein
VTPASARALIGARPDLERQEHDELLSLVQSSPDPARACSVPRRAPHPGGTAGLDLVEREQLAALGRLERLPSPSSNPLTTVAVIPRAVTVLVALGEDPRRVGQVLLEANARTAARRVRAAVRRARRAIAPAVPHLETKRRAALGRLIPHERARWAFLLRCSGAFPFVDEISGALRVDRATAYRDLAKATMALTMHFATATKRNRP